LRIFATGIVYLRLPGIDPAGDFLDPLAALFAGEILTDSSTRSRPPRKVSRATSAINFQPYFSKFMRQPDSANP
jgi:hypothetical protein